MSNTFFSIINRPFSFLIFITILIISCPIINNIRLSLINLSINANNAGNFGREKKVIISGTISKFYY